MIGHVLDEVIRFPDHQIGPVLGGPAAYASVAASVLGARTGLVSVVGPDPPDYLLRPFSDTAVDLAGLHRRGQTRTTLLTYDHTGAKTALYTKVAPPIRWSDIPPAYLGSRAFLICPMDFEVPASLVNRLKHTEALVMTDLGGYGGVVATHHPTDDAAVASNVRRLVRGIDVVKASAEDCVFVSGLTGPEANARRLVEWGARLAIITLGEAGAVLLDSAGHEEWIQAFPARTIDVTGAGDVFCGAFLAEFVRTHDARGAAIYASAAASLVVERTGGPSLARMPSDDAVRARIGSPHTTSQPNRRRATTRRETR